MNATDHARFAALNSDIQAVQAILQRWASEMRELMAENEHLRAEISRRSKTPIEPRAESQLFLTTKQLAKRWGMHQASVLRKVRLKELPCLVMNSRSLRIAMKDVLVYEDRNRC